LKRRCTHRRFQAPMQCATTGSTGAPQLPVWRVRPFHYLRAEGVGVLLLAKHPLSGCSRLPAVTFNYSSQSGPFQGHGWFVLRKACLPTWARPRSWPCVARACSPPCHGHGVWAHGPWLSPWRMGHGAWTQSHDMHGVCAVAACMACRLMQHGIPCCSTCLRAAVPCNHVACVHAALRAALDEEKRA
jgi:hypothetical protein